MNPDFDCKYKQSFSNMKYGFVVTQICVWWCRWSRLEHAAGGYMLKTDWLWRRICSWRAAHDVWRLSPSHHHICMMGHRPVHVSEWGLSERVKGRSPCRTHTLASRLLLFWCRNNKLITNSVPGFHLHLCVCLCWGVLSSFKYLGGYLDIEDFFFSFLSNDM